MLKYLIDDKGIVHQADGDDMQVAQQVLRILLVSEHVVLKFHGVPDSLLCRWSVIERNTGGYPDLIGWEGPDGGIEILDSGDES